MNQTKFVTTRKSERNHLIDVIKFFCIICVMVLHTRPNDPQGGFGFFWVSYCVAIFFLVTGFNYYNSYEYKNVNTIGEAYNPWILLRKFIRLFVPWIFIFAICAALWYTIYQVPWSFINFIQHFFIGGYRGAYYITISFQLILLYPVIHFIIKKWKFKGFIAIFLFNALFELFRWSVGLNPPPYTSICFRVVSYVGFGAYLASTQNEAFSFREWKKVLLLIISFLFGLTILLLAFAFNILFNCPLFDIFNIHAWLFDQSWISSFYCLPIIFVIFKKIKVKNKWMGYLGRCTYSFFLTQMVYFIVLNSFQWDQFALGNFYLQLPVNCAICFSAGYIYYLIVEKKITQTIMMKISELQKTRQGNKKKV